MRDDDIHIPAGGIHGERTGGLSRIDHEPRPRLFHRGLQARNVEPSPGCILDVADSDERRLRLERPNQIGRQIARRIVLDELYFALAAGRQAQPRSRDCREVCCHDYDLAAADRWHEKRDLSE